MLLVVFPGSYRPTLRCKVGSEKVVSGYARDGLYVLPRRVAGQQRVAPLLTQNRVFRVAPSSAARSSTSVLSLDSAPAPYAIRNLSIHRRPSTLREDMTCISP